MTSPVTLTDLQLSYHEANRSLIALVHNLRQKNTVIKIRDLNACFTGALWQRSAQASGHLKFTHKVTKVIVEYQNHGQEDVAKHIQRQILDQTQKHLNILNDDIFAYTIRNWKTEPDYPASLRRYQQLSQPQSGG